MRLTSKGRYAVSAMVDLSKFQAKGPVTLAAISERQYISLSYLEQLFRRLREDGLVCSIRGPGGGYLLNRPANEISVADVIRAVSEEIQATGCTDSMHGQRYSRRCDTHTLWEALNQHIYRFLDVVTLQDVRDKQVQLDQVELAPVEHYLASPDPVADERIAAVS